MPSKTNINPPASFFLLLFLLFLPQSESHAVWPENGIRVVESTRYGNSQFQIVGDDAGGVIFVWRLGQVMEEDDIYAQRVDGSGNIRWDPAGVPICAADGLQTNPCVVPDGTGGAIVIWNDFRNDLGNGTEWDIYAQRVDAAGNIAWAIDGVPICTAQNSQYLKGNAVADGQGGVIVTWEDHRDITGPDIYVQRIDALGSIQYPTDGVAACAEPSVQEEPDIVSDQLGGAIVAWRDYRNEPHGDIYAQRADGQGQIVWAPDGIVVCGSQYYQRDVRLESDGMSGAIVAWRDYRSGEGNALFEEESDLYAQRIDADGVPLWQSNGVPVSAVPGKPEKSMQLVSDGTGGVVVTWQDFRLDKYGSIYAQRIDGDGALVWAPEGVTVSHVPLKPQLVPKIATDGEGGAIVVWEDRRDWTNNRDDIYAQRIDAEGNLLWAPEGNPVCTVEQEQTLPGIISDGQGGAVIAWNDLRSHDEEIFAQRLDPLGEIVPTVLQTFSAHIEGFVPTLTWTLSDHGEAIRFHILRAEVPADPYLELPSPVINRDDLVYVFRDETARPGATYSYRVDVTDTDGRMILFETGPIRVPPAASVLYQNHPNPFHQNTLIRYTVVEETRVTLRIYTVAGKMVKTLVDELASPDPDGVTVVWDGTNEAGSPVSSGVYLYRLSGSRLSQTRKMILLRK
ncbi:MAG: T9SS type A sorting domain-containing protein [Candidatus Latescibacterota bacterium]|nr:MAG: T9SS type A sorting domain-containing protein [Candidatus Latescibacterota bacterium]